MPFRMKPLQLDIDTTWGQIGLRTRLDRMVVENRPARLKIQSEPAAVWVEDHSISLDIDMRQTYADIGLKSPRQLLRDQVTKGKEVVLETIARWVEEGDRMADVHLEPDVIANLAAEAQEKRVETGLGLVPEHRPEVKVDAHFRMEVDEGSVLIEYRPGKPSLHVQNGFIETYLQVRPQVVVRCVGSILDTTA